MIKDPVFLADAQKANLDVDPVSGAELQDLVQQILATPKPITKRLADILALNSGDKVYH
jgi:hypothetical protein